MKKFWALIASLCFCACVLSQARYNIPNFDLASSVQAASDDTFKRIWTTPAPGLRAFGISPDGHYVGVINNVAPGSLLQKTSLWRWSDRPGTPLWTRTERGVSEIEISRDGLYVLTWSKMNLTQRMLKMRRGADGICLLPLTIDGAVWDVRLADDGRNAAISSGAHSLYIVSLDDRPILHKWLGSLLGSGNSLAFSPNGNTLVVATWDETSISRYTTRGSVLWQFPVRDQARQSLAGRIFDIQTTRNGKSILGVSYTNVRRGDIHLYIWPSLGNGSPSWNYSLGSDAYHPRVFLSANGRYAAAGYIRVISRGELTVPERRLALLDTQKDKIIWEEGNLLFSPELVAFSPNGERITVSDGQHTLYNLNSQGRVTATYLLRGLGSIKQITATPDGRYILIYTSDGSLSLLQAGSDSS